MGEIWRDIDGYEGKYQVSNWGRVRNVKRNIIIKPYLNHKGYEKVSLSRGTKGNTDKHRVHRLVALAFIPNPNDLPQVNHKDGNKRNNSVSNLEWCTNLQNAQHAALLRRGVMVV